MDYRQIINMMQYPDQSDRNSLSALQELLKEYPYFQTGHLLLAKAMHIQEHIRYDKQLKSAAIYAADRKILHNLIHHSAKIVPVTVAATSSPFVLEELPPEPVTEELVSENPFVASTHEVPVSTPLAAGSDTVLNPVDDTLPEPVIYHPVAQEEPLELIQDYSPDKGAEPSSDPREILKKRLAELLGETPSPSSAPVEVKGESTTETPVVIEATKAEATTDKTESGEQLSSGTDQIEEPVPDDTSELTSTETEILPDPAEILDEETSKNLKPIEKIEFEYALEESILQSLENLPELSSSPEYTGSATQSSPVTAAETTDTGSFTSWLKMKSGGNFGRYEIVHAYGEPESNTTIKSEDPVPPVHTELKRTEISEVPSLTVSLSADQKSQTPASFDPAEKDHEIKDKKALIERFIATEPKIVPSKAEFYSPANQARKSVEEHEDLVSETLANIYREQGNFLKARSCFEKLGLLHPEKSRYFAALVKEIDDQFNQPNQEDL